MGGIKLRDYQVTDLRSACMGGAKAIGNPCSLERTALNASTALTAEATSVAILSQPAKTLLECDYF